MFCGNFGAKLRDDDRFCPKCGAKTRLARQMEQTPEETAVPASSSSSAESASNAGAKPRKTIRLKSVPTGQVQNDSKPEQAEPVKTEPEPAVPVKEESQEKPPQQAAEPAGVSESEPVYHASEPEQKDTADGESIRCGNRGATLKAGTKFCPECGAPTGLPPIEKPILGAGTRRKIPPQRTVIIVSSLALVLVVFILVLASGSGKSDSDGNRSNSLVENGNPFGLAFDMTVEDFIDCYNGAYAKGSSTIDEEYTEILEQYDISLNMDSVKSFSGEFDGETAYMWSVSAETKPVSMPLSIIMISEYDSYVTNIVVSGSDYSEWGRPDITQLSEYMCNIVTANILTALHLTDSDNLNDNIQNVILWNQDTNRQIISGNPAPVRYFENNVLYTYDEEKK